MKFKIYSLEDCEYSKSAEEMMKHYKIPAKIIGIKRGTDDYYNYKKIHQMSTYPHVFIITDSEERLKIGGYDDLYKFMYILTSKSQTILADLQDFCIEYGLKYRTILKICNQLVPYLHQYDQWMLTY